MQLYSALWELSEYLLFGGLAECSDKMKRPLMSEYGISSEQLGSYESYLVDLEERKRRLNKISERLPFYIGGLIYLFLFWVVFGMLGAAEEISLVKKIVVTIVYCILTFPIFFLFVVFLNMVLMLLRIDTLCDYIISALISKPRYLDYYKNVELYKKAFIRHEKYINDLEKKYPDISFYNYEIKKYHNFILQSIEKQEVKREYSRIMNMRRMLREKEWLDMNGFDFEESVAYLYKKMGYRVKLTSKVGDGGVDIRMWDAENKYIIVQCKNHRGKLSPSVVRDLRGTMDFERAGKAILIGSGGFSSTTVDYANRASIELIDIGKLLDMYAKAYEINDGYVEVEVKYISRLGINNAEDEFNFFSIGRRYNIYCDLYTDPFGARMDAEKINSMFKSFYDGYEVEQYIHEAVQSSVTYYYIKMKLRGDG